MFGVFVLGRGCLDLFCSVVVFCFDLFCVVVVLVCFLVFVVVLVCFVVLL